MTGAMMALVSRLHSDRCDATLRTELPRDRIALMLNEWFGEVVGRVERMRADIQLTPTSLSLTDDIVLSLSGMEPAARADMEGIARAGGAGLFRREGTADSPRYVSFAHNDRATAILRRAPFMRILYDIFCGFPAEGLSAHVPQRIYFLNMQGYLEFISSMAPSPVMARIASECSPRAMQLVWPGYEEADGIEWTKRRSGLADILAALHPCAAQARLAAEILGHAIHMDASQEHPPEVAALLADAAPEGAQDTTCIVSSHGDAASETTRVRTMNVYLAVLELLYRILQAVGDPGEQGRAARWPKGMMLPRPVLCALVTLCVHTTKGIVHFSTQKGVYETVFDMCVAQGANPDIIPTVTPYMSPFVVQPTQGAGPVAESCRVLTTLMHILHRFPHALDISLSTWAYVALRLGASMSIDAGLLWDGYYIDVVNAMLGFRPLLAMENVARAVAGALGAPGPVGGRVNRKVTGYRCMYDMHAVCGHAQRCRELAFAALLRELPQEGYITVSVPSSKVPTMTLERTWRWFLERCAEHGVEVDGDAPQLICEVQGQTQWSLPAAQFDLFVAVMPLLQHTWYYPCISSVLRLWSNRSCHYLIVAWAARRMRLGDVVRGEGTQGHGWAEGVIRALMGAHDVEEARSALSQACAGAPAVAPASVLYTQEDMAAVRLAMGVHPLSKSPRHTHVVQLLAGIDSAGAPDGPFMLPATRHAPPLLLVAPPGGPAAEWQMGDQVQTAYRLFDRIRVSAGC